MVARRGGDTRNTSASTTLAVTRQSRRFHLRRRCRLRRGISWRAVAEVASRRAGRAAHQAANSVAHRARDRIRRGPVRPHLGRIRHAGPGMEEWMRACTRKARTGTLHTVSPRVAGWSQEPARTERHRGPRVGAPRAPRTGRSVGAHRGRLAVLHWMRARSRSTAQPRAGLRATQSRLPRPSQTERASSACLSTTSATSHQCGRRRTSAPRGSGASARAAATWTPGPRRSRVSGSRSGRVVRRTRTLSIRARLRWNDPSRRPQNSGTAAQAGSGRLWSSSLIQAGGLRSPCTNGGASRSNALRRSSVHTRG